MSKFVDISKLQDISIVEFLARLGHHPVRKSGKEQFYHSMLRETKKQTPSFTVWDAGNCWKDWGGANGTGIYKGGIVQLGMAYWSGSSFVEVLNKIKEVCDMDTTLIPSYIPPKIYPPDPEKEAYQWELVQLKDIGNNFVLNQYLHARGLFDIAQRQQVKEVYYTRKGVTGSQSVYYGIGWQNEHGGWEFANAKGFKSSIGAKGISIIPGDSQHTAVFEGYMDYLSWQKLHLEMRPTVIVLNAVTMLGFAIERIKKYQLVDVYFDNDGPGRRCTQNLTSEIPRAVDRSFEYRDYKDYNEKLKADLNKANFLGDEINKEILNLGTFRKR